MSKVIVSEATPVASPIHMKDLGKGFSNLYIEFEFSNSQNFNIPDLVHPTDGRVKIEGSAQGFYWGLADTQNNAGTIRFNSPTGDYERVSMGGIVDQMKLTPTTPITGATYYRAIIQRS